MDLFIGLARYGPTKSAISLVVMMLTNMKTFLKKFTDALKASVINDISKAVVELLNKQTKK